MESWDERIEVAARVGRFTAQDVGRALNWTSCAVGERLSCSGVDTTAVFQTRSQAATHLYRLGLQFAEAVQFGDLRAARRLHGEIWRANIGPLKD